MFTPVTSRYPIQPGRRFPARPPPARLAALGFALCLAVVGSAGAQTRQVFVSSASGSANFSSWPSATPGAVGLEAADSICRNLATTAGLARPDAFRAWLSDSLDDAWCRVQDVTGTRDSACDGATALPGAGPWARIGDGGRWGGRLTALIEQQGPLLPLDRTELGAPVPDLDLYWTGTDETGRAYDRLASELCADWTSNAAGAFTLLGSTFETRLNWTTSFGGSCGAWRHLVCLETGVGAIQPQVATLGPAALAFVTSRVGSGNLASWPGADGLSGLAAADAVCHREAAAFHLPSPLTFVAWLSTSTLDASSRLPTGLAWRRLDGTGIAAGRADLLDGRLAAPINQIPAGAYLPQPPEWTAPMWTGTAFDGTRLPGETCLDWTSTSDVDSGLVGSANSAAADWTDGRPFPCSALVPLYCFSTAEMLFWGIFESGDALDWSPHT
ncbi:MAG: hypothetical protein K8I65_15045 [Thermoanaerobaculia bacterium]|nr:hypothetical protein [Thermoanaerobaculia bacterium]